MATNFESPGSCLVFNFFGPDKITDLETHKVLTRKPVHYLIALSYEYNIDTYPVYADKYKEFRHKG